MNREKLEKDLIRDECLNGKPALKPYRDSKGKLTIGVGRNLDDKGISEGEAYHFLRNDVEDAEDELDAKYPWWRKLDEVRQRVMVNMCFNMGIKRLSGFEKMLAHAMIGEFDMAAAEMVDSKWAREDVGPRAVRLAEAMRHGGDT